MPQFFFKSANAKEGSWASANAREVAAASVSVLECGFS